MDTSPGALHRIYKWIYPSIRTRITFPFLVVTLIIAAIGAYFAANLVAGSVQERFKNQLADSARAAQSVTIDIERQQLSTLRLMVFTDGVGLAIADRNRGELLDLLEPIAQNAEVDSVIVFDVNGEGLVQLRSPEEGEFEYTASIPGDLSQLESIRRVIELEADTLGDKFIDVVDQSEDHIFYISAPVQDEDGVLVGGIAVGIETQRLAERISEQSLSGVVLYTDDGEILGNSLRAVPDEAVTISDATASDLLVEVQQDSPIRSLDENVSNPYQIMYAPFFLRNEQMGLLGVALPSQFLTDQSTSSRNLVMATFTAMFFFVLVVGYLTARTITAPVSQLIETTRAIQRGDLSRRVQLDSPDELGELGQSFNAMTDELVDKQERISHLYEMQVVETARFNAIFNSITDPVFLVDTGGTVLIRNRAAETFWKDLHDMSGLGVRVEGMIKNPEKYVVNEEVLELLGAVYSVLSVPVMTAEKYVLGHAIWFRDITRLMRAEQMKDQLMMQMSHELRTPLSAARGYLDLVRMLETDSLTDTGIDYMDKALVGMSTLETMLNHVIDVNSMIAGRFEIKQEHFNLVEIVCAQVDEWQPRFKEKNFNVTVMSEAEHLPVYGDAFYINQAVNHVFENAWGYTMPGGSVIVTIRQENSYGVFSIADTGVGIYPDEIDYIFDRMFRGTAAEAGDTDRRGLGLGLYISKNIIDAHLGKIDVKSEPKAGTVVTIKLPLDE